MAKPLIDLEVVLRKTGVSEGTADGDALALLLDAVSAEMRRLARRDFEGVSGTSYTEVIRLASIDTQPSGPTAGNYGPAWRSLNAYGYYGPDMLVTLRHTPVLAITSVHGQLFDGTLDTTALWIPSQYRVEDAIRGALRLRGQFAFLAEYLQVVYTTTGDIPIDISAASGDWVAARWSELQRNPGLASYGTGADRESYFPALVGVPPASVARALLGNWHAVGGGIVR